MNRIAAACLSTFLLAFLLSSCGGGSASDPSANGGGQPTGSVAVNLPAGSSIDLTSARLVSGGQSQSIQADGSSEAVTHQASRGLAVVESSDGTPLLMGMIDENNQQIDIQSTLVAALFYGLGTVFQPEEVRARYFATDPSELVSQASINEATRLFLLDKNYLSSQGFKDLVQQMITEVTDKPDTVDIVFANKAPGTLDIVQNNVKSGLQLEEIDYESFRVTNRYRRRTHAFVYRTGYKAEGLNTNEVILIPDVVAEDPQPSPLHSKPVPLTKAIREFNGVIQDWMAGDSMKMAVVQSDPMVLTVEEGNLYDLYRVRVVGPNLLTPARLTALEMEKVDELSWDTLIYDMLLPLMLDALSEAKIVGGPNLEGMKESHFTAFRKSVEIFASSTESVMTPFKNGDMSKALEELIYSLLNNTSSNLATDIFEGLVAGATAQGKEMGYDIAIQGGERAAELAGNIATILKVTDLVLKAADYSRIVLHLGKASQIEEWDVRAKIVPVTLQPKNSIAYPYILKPLEARVQNTQLSTGDIFEYRWTTTGGFGVLRKDNGQKGTSVSTSSTESLGSVNFFANVDDADLPTDAEQQVKVEVFIQGSGPESKIGEDTITLKVKAYDYIIRPDGLTVDGDSKVVLRVQYPDGEENITNNQYYDYKLSWRTAGLYGAFSGSRTDANTFNSNQILYIASDEDVARGEEIIRVDVYRRDKNDHLSSWRLIEQADATIIIENDERVDYDTQAMTFYNACLDGSEVFRMVVVVPKVAEATRYRVSPIGKVWYGWANVWGPAYTVSWTNDNWSSYYVTDLGAAFQIHMIRATSSTCGPDNDYIAGRYQTMKGYALIETHY